IRQIACRTLSGSVLVALAAVVFCGPLGAADEPDQDKEESQWEQRLKNMQRSAAQYTFSTADTLKEAFKFHETPYLRSSNPVGESKDGAVYVWTNHGRPQAVLKLYTFNNKTYTHAWQSLSESAFVGERNGQVFWNPTQPGIEL